MNAVDSPPTEQVDLDLEDFVETPRDLSPEYVSDDTVDADFGVIIEVPTKVETSNPVEDLEEPLETRKRKREKNEPPENTTASSDRMNAMRGMRAAAEEEEEEEEEEYFRQVTHFPYEVTRTPHGVIITPQAQSKQNSTSGAPTTSS